VWAYGRLESRVGNDVIIGSEGKTTLIMTSSSSETPGAILTAWLHRFFAFFTNKHHIASELLEHSDRTNPVFSESRGRVIAAGRPLLTAAQHSHEIRDDLTLEQILDLIVAVARIHGDPGYLEPILQSSLDGLRPPNHGGPA